MPGSAPRATGADRRRGLGVDDLGRLAWLSDCAAAPAGDALAAVETRLDVERDRVVRRVLMVSDSGAVRRIESPGGSDTGPRWSPDGGRLAFVSDRDGSSRVWIVDADGERPRPAADVERCWAAPAWAPHGDRLAIAAIDGSSAAVPQLDVDVAEVPFKLDGVRGVATSPRSSIWIVSPGGMSPRRIGVPRAVVAGAPSWSPDGSAIAFLARAADRGAVSSRAAVWTLDLASGTARCLAGADGSAVAHAWSPDGSVLAYVGHRRGDAEGVDRDLWLVSAGGGQPRRIPHPTGRSIGTIVRSDDARGENETRLFWSRSRDRIYVQFADGGRGQLAWFDLAGDSGVVVSGDRVCLSFSLDAAGSSIGFVASTPRSPGELYRCDADGGRERRVTFLNDGPLDECDLFATEPLEIAADDGHAVEGWITPGAPRGRGGPLVVDVHGGPHYSVGWRFSFERQRLASLGMTVLSTNPRGSQGYGEAFATAVIGDWGGRDHDDVMAAVDAALVEGWGDGDRLAIMGVSYGGYLAQWATTRSSRFRAAISVNGISNLLALWAHGVDTGSFVTAELGGEPFGGRAGLYTDRSPLVHADRITTPLLLLHGEHDQDSPIAQSEQLFVALRRLERVVAFVRVPDAGHLMMLDSRPSVRRRLAERIDEWLRTHLDTEEER